MGRSVAMQLVESHLLEGGLEVGGECGIRVDQTLMQDATGTLVMLELEAMGISETHADLSVQYVDHNLIQADFKNPDDHRFLRSACQRFGIWYSPPGNGVSHPVHQERFGVPGKTLLGSDSHTCSAGAIGMLALGAGGIEVAMAMAGQPYRFTMPEIWGVELTGTLPEWVSAKDVILEMLRRHGVSGGVGRILEYYGPGLSSLSAMDRHVIANMGAELGATATVFPSDSEVKRFLREQGREDDWVELAAEPSAAYQHHEHLDLGSLEPLIAMPSSPGNVRPVREVAGEEIHQAYIGSSANPGYRDIAIAAHILDGKHVHDRVSLDINPASRRTLSALIADSHLGGLISAGARLHQVGCNGCIGMGQAPATNTLSLRTVPRNFPGRSGTREDKVCLVSPETAAASALTGVVTDPRTLACEYKRVTRSTRSLRRVDDWSDFLPPGDSTGRVPLVKGPNIKTLPNLEPLPECLDLPILLKLGDNISTDEILPAGNDVLPLRSNIEAIREFSFAPVGTAYSLQATEVGDHMIVAGENYGQGSSREHAALAPRTLGLRAVLAKGFARIHRQNLANFGVLPLEFANPADYDRVGLGDSLAIPRLRERLAESHELEVAGDSARVFRVRHCLSERQVQIVLAGGLIQWMRNRVG